MWAKFYAWLLTTGVPFALFKAASFIGLTMPDGLIRDLGGVVPKTNDSAGINAATQAVFDRGYGFVALLKQDYTLTPNVPLIERNGVSHIGIAPFMACTTGIFDTFWSIGPGAGTRIIGDNSTDGWIHNNVDRVSPLGTGGNLFATDCLSGAHKKNITLVNVRRPFAIGAKNAAGAYGCEYHNIFTVDCAQGSDWQNFAHCSWDFMFDRCDSLLGGWAWRWKVSVSKTVVEPGNSRVGKRLFTTRLKIRQRGIVVEADSGGDPGNGGILNQFIIEAAQSNRFSSGAGGVEETDTFTFTSGSTSITMADATKYPANFPFKLDTASGTAFLDGPTYYFNSTGATTGTLSSRPYGNAISANASGNVNVRTKGYALMEVQSSESGTLSTIRNSKFRNLDLEGVSSASLQMIFGGNNEVNITQAFTDATYPNLILRNCTNPMLKSTFPIRTDIDAASADSFFLGARGTSIKNSYIGRGLWIYPAVTGDGIKGQLNLNARAVTPDPASSYPQADFQNEQYAGVGSLLRAGLPIIQPQNFDNGSGTAQLVVALGYITGGGTRTYNGTVNDSANFLDVQYTLPTTNTNFVGWRTRIVHAGSGVAGVVTQGGTLINLVSGLTQQWFTRGQALEVELCRSSSGTLYYAVNITSASGTNTQTVTGATTGTPTQLTNDPSDGLVTIDAAGTLATHTVTLPTELKSVINQRRRICFLKAVTALTVNGATTINNAPASAAVGDVYEVVKVAANTWSFIK